ncbi:MAG: type II toxin-antitoxin system RelE/ParE family toxin [Roseburia sp.]|nr:type II toxin-antitoxin system RelE/ParE family toxin [Roseburia sp.]
MNYNVLVSDEAIEDIFGLVKYIHMELYNPEAAEALYHNLKQEVRNMGDFPLKFSDSGIRYRGYVIHKKVYESYLIFYVVNDEKREVYVLRVVKELMNWQKILTKVKIYHFSNDQI